MNPIDPPRMALTVGPLQYHWPRRSVIDFYAELAESAADCVVLGETVCSRRRELKSGDWLALARDLRACGKEVLLATPPLIDSDVEMRALHRLVEQDDFAIEAGDAAALQLLLTRRRPFVLGPHINIYSRAALVEHVVLGARRWAAPVELSLAALALINPPDDPLLTSDGAPIATEAFAYGRLPLAFSARCFTARHHRLHKDDCGFRCLDDADGLLLTSSEGLPFLVLNGTQTQSAATHCLLAEGPALRAAGVSRLRLSPTSQGFAEVLAAFEAVFNQGADAAPALAALQAHALPGGLADGYAHHRAGIDWSRGSAGGVQ